MLQITLHGTGAGHPSGDRGASAATVRFNGGSVLLLDAGEGCSRALIRDGIALEDIVAAAISHMHADHWAGFPNLVMGWSLGNRTSPVDLYLPPGSIDFFRNVLEFSYILPERLGFPMHFHELNRFELPDGWALRPFRTTHLNGYSSHAERLGLSYPAYGYVLRNGDRKVVFSQDLASEDDLVPELPGAELVVCEMAHVDPARLIRLATDAGVGRVVFTHIPPDGPSLPEERDGIEWLVATDGLMLSLD